MGKTVVVEAFFIFFGPGRVMCGVQRAPIMTVSKRFTLIECHMLISIIEIN